MGSKSRIAKYIVPIINSYLSDSIRDYIEPFVGGANIIDKVDFEFRLGYDKNKYLIALLDYVAKGGILPDTISEEIYYKVRDNKDRYIDWKVGLVGFCASYGGRFFEGYPRGNKADGTPRDYTNEAIRNLQTQAFNIRDVIFKVSDYMDIKPYNKSVIYCDPPYRYSKPYKVELLGRFDSDDFWNWAEDMSKSHIVLVSEYEAPIGWNCIWSLPVKSNLKATGSKESVERLFIYRS